MAIFKTIQSVFPFIFATLSLAFVITSFLSSDWARQEFYPVVPAEDGLQVQWQNASFAKYRSPFVICGYNETRSDDGTRIAQIETSCQRFKIYGAGKTSCESFRSFNYTVTTTDSIRDDRMCQQVHMSGNLMVAALFFVIIGFTITIPLTYYSLALIFGKQGRELEYDNDAVTATNVEANNGNHKSETVSSVRPHHGRSRRYHHKNKYVSHAITLLTYSMIVSFSIAAAATLLSQFYGILGLIQSNPENGWFSTRLAPPLPISDEELSAGPWVQGTGLTVYTSLAWFFGALAAGTAGGVWGGWLHG